MAFFGGIFGGNDAGEKGAGDVEQFNREANRDLSRLFGQSAGEFGGRQDQLRSDFTRQQGLNEAGFNPFIDIGQDAARNLQQSSTAQGLNELLSQITGGGTFQALRDEQERAAQGQLSAAGLGGSGLGVQQLSQISPQLALQLAGNLTQNQQFLSGQGLQGAGQRGQLGNQLTLGQGGLSSNLTQQLANLRNSLSGRRSANITGIGEARQSGRLADQQADSAAFGSLIGAVGSIAGGPIGASLAGGLGGLGKSTSRGVNSRSTTQFF